MLKNNVPDEEIFGALHVKFQCGFLEQKHFGDDSRFCRYRKSSPQKLSVILPGCYNNAP